MPTGSAPGKAGAGSALPAFSGRPQSGSAAPVNVPNIVPVEDESAAVVRAAPAAERSAAERSAAERSDVERAGAGQITMKHVEAELNRLEAELTK